MTPKAIFTSLISLSLGSLIGCILVDWSADSVRYLMANIVTTIYLFIMYKLGRLK